MKPSVFIWHHFEQQEAGCLDKILKKTTRQECFKELTKVVDIAVGHELCCGEDIKWMQTRLEEIATNHPELILG